MAKLSMDFLTTQLNVEFVDILHLDDSFGSSYKSELMKFAEDTTRQSLLIIARPEAAYKKICFVLKRL
jgi:hypothetical protein